MNTRKTKFLREPKHALDLRSQRETVQAVNSILNGQIQMGSKADLHLSDGNAIWEIPSVSVPVQMFPFKIYQIANTTDKTLNARTFQIRGGLVGFRSNYLLPDFNITQTVLYYQGNFELPLIATGTDDFPDSPPAYGYGFATSESPDWFAPPTANTGGNVTLLNGTPALICDNSPLGLNPTNVQIVVPDLSAGGVAYSATFWINLIDDADDGPYTELWGMIGTPPFDKPALSGNAEITFAVGKISFDHTGAVLSISQAQTSHLLNRYLELTPLPPKEVGNVPQKFAGFPGVFRGWWNNTATGNNLAGSLFYPGDIVVDNTVNVVTKSAAGGVDLKYWISYVCIIKQMAILSSTPHGDGANWKLWGIYLNGL